MTSKTISTTVAGYNFAASDTQLTITATGNIDGSKTGAASVFGSTARSGESILNLGKVGNSNYLYGIVLEDGATITNGSATATTATITGSQIGIKVQNLPGTITNFGAISADQKGIVLEKGGVITNGSAADTTARISSPGYVAIDVGIVSGAGKVTNFGTILGEVNLYAGGSIANQATGKITGLNAIYLAGGAGTVTNLGAISGHVHVGTGQVVNGSATNHTATIGGGTYGVYLGTGTVTNFGTISGTSDAVAMQDGTVFIAEAGSKLVGGASYGQGATLVFGAAGGAGTISGLGTYSITGSTTDKFRQMQTYQVQAGANWTLSGANTVRSVDSMTVLGTLGVTGTLVNSGTLVGAGTLAASGAAKVTLNAAGIFTVAKVTQAGTSTITVGGALAYAGTWTQTAGTLSVTSTLTLKGAADSFSGALAGAGTVAITAGSDRFTGSTLSVAHLNITGAATTVTLAGTITNSGSVTAATGHLLVALAGATLTGGGHLTLTSAATNMITAAGASGVLTNFNNVIQGGGQLGGGKLRLINDAAGSIIGNAAVALVVNSGALTITNAGTITASGAGGVEVKSAIANTGLLVAAGGVLTLDQAVTGAGSARITNGTLNAAGAFSENVQFTGTTGKFTLVHSQTYTGKITGFSKTAGESLDLRDITFAAATTKATFSGTAASGTLTVTDGTHTAKIGLVGNYVGVAFKATNDGHGGTTIVAGAAPSVAHFVTAMAAMGGGAGASTPITQLPPPTVTTLLAHARA